VKFGAPFLVDIDREKFIIFKEYGLKHFFLPPPKLIFEKIGPHLKKLLGPQEALGTRLALP
jgi:hypothetical protein